MKNKTFGLTLQVTKGCNLQCTYCYESGFHRDEIPDLETFLSAFEHFLDVFKFRDQKIDLVYIGGEPSLNPDFIEKTLSLMYKMNLLNSVTIITNGIIIQNILKSISASEIPENVAKELIGIQISYDGRQINDKYRLANKKPTSDIVLKSIKLVKEAGFKISIKSVLPVNEIHLVPEIMKEFEELGFNYQPTEDFSALKDTTEEDIKNYIKYFDKYFIDVLKIEIDRKKHGLEPLSRWFQDYSLNKSITECHAGVKSLAINEKGTIQFCQQVDYLKDPGVLNLKNISDLSHKSLEEISEYLDSITEMFQCNLYNSDREECKNCEALFCVKCPLVNFEETKDITNMYGGYTKENFRCIYYKNLSKYLYIYDKYFDKIKE